MQRPFYAPEHSGLQADFYLLVLAAVYHADGLWGEASFDVYARQMPDRYGYLVLGGVSEAIESALRLGFSVEEIRWLWNQDVFARASEGWWNALENMRFEGEIRCMAEGSVVFPGEPVLRVTAPLPQAVLLETRILQALGHATAVATRAARLTQVAGGRKLFDFSSRRLPGQEAAMLAARAAIVGGFTGTTNSLAAAALEVPTMGTLSSGFLATYASDTAALEAFRVHFPEVGYVSLPEGDVVEAVLRLAPHRRAIRIVRLDEWDLDGNSRRLRGALNAAGMERTRILGSGALDEDRIAELVRRGAPVDMLAVGRSLVSGTAVDFCWKISEIARGPDREPVRHVGATAWPGPKQVLRFADHDLVCLDDEAEALAGEQGRPLLDTMVSYGERTVPEEPVQVARDRCAEQIAALPEDLRGCDAVGDWPVRQSPRLQALRSAPRT